MARYCLRVHQLTIEGVAEHLRNDIIEGPNTEVERIVRNHWRPPPERSRWVSSLSLRLRVDQALSVEQISALLAQSLIQELERY